MRGDFLEPRVRVDVENAVFAERLRLARGRRRCVNTVALRQMEIRLDHVHCGRVRLGGNEG